jgi:hypothetical protein
MIAFIRISLTVCRSVQVGLFLTRRGLLQVIIVR